MQKRSYNYLENDISAIVKLSHIPPNVMDEFKLNKDNSQWLKELLIELNEKASEANEEQKLSETELNLNLKIEKKHLGQYGEFVLIKADINGTFATECVKTLTPLKDIVHFQFQACFLNESFKDDEEYRELTEIFIDHDVYELYFQNRGSVDLKETFHEQIFLNIDPYPTAETPENVQ